MTPHHPALSRAALGVLMAGVDATGPDLPGWTREALAGGLGAVCLFGVNTPDIPTARAITDVLRAAGPDVVVAVDEEGGTVSRLQLDRGSSLPSAAALGQVDDPDLTRRCGAAIGRLVALAGVDLDLAPVLDVASEPANPVIGVRSFGATPDTVRTHGEAFARGLADAEVASCAKHFPGHGATTTDSHLTLPVVAGDRATVLARDVTAFSAGVDAVMTAHLRVPALGEGVASLSSWSTALLRDAGFDGVIVTDALGMAGASGEIGLGEACVRALEAGADLLCLDSPQNRDPEDLLRTSAAAVDAALSEGRLDRRRLTESAARVRRLRRRSLPPLTDLPAAMREADLVGAEAAERALVTRGDVQLREQAVVVDLRRHVNIAAGERRSPFVVTLTEARPDTLRARSLDDVPQGATPVIVVDDRSQAESVAGHPTAVVVHCGVITAAPEVARLVCLLGDTRPSAKAAVRRMVAP